jgi:hypothetical protein
MPDDLAAVPLLLQGRAGWTPGQLVQLRALIDGEYAGPDRADALAALDRLLAAR